LAEAQRLHRQSLVRVPTARLNKVVRAAVERNAPPLRGTRQPKIYYATQAAVQPPTIVLFCSHPRLLSKQYQRYLLGTLRAELDFAEVPIKLYLRHREASGTRGEIDVGQGPGKE
jgi:GTP-binding protein